MESLRLHSHSQPTNSSTNKQTSPNYPQDRAAKEAKVKDLERRAHDVQMLKFGQVRL